MTHFDNVGEPIPPQNISNSHTNESQEQRSNDSRTTGNPCSVADAAEHPSEIRTQASTQVGPAKLKADSVQPPSAPQLHSHFAGKNFLLLAVHQITMRTGWIFKTESIVMPVVLDSIGGSGWLRGFLPMLSRLGQSVVPLLLSNRISNHPLKKHWLVASSLAMGILFLILSAIWTTIETKPPIWLPAMFLLIYAVFFASTGLNQVVLGTVHGKLVAINRRGRLMLVANGIGSVVSVICAWFLLQRWMDQSSGNFVLIFAATGTLFVAGGVVAWWLHELPDQHETKKVQLRRLVPNSMKLLREDRQFRLLAIVAACFGMSITLIPHYQALAIERLDLQLNSLIPWLIAQNIGVGLLSFPAGSFADRFGNLLVLRLFLGLLCATPLMALWLTTLGSLGGNLFVLVFVILAMMPITMRIIKNYTLELTSHEHQPVYLSTLMICMAIPPVLTSTLVGYMIDRASFEWSFGLVTMVMLFGWGVTWRMRDPRHAND